ncbi:tectonic-1 [Protopterus annectens]|uniref:tectonic-1 n=1 Tax=Protopterus annectens TaxID=7888 RepID=UPI001CFA9FF5|nr:tectonic-1 [Protopterus annectens]
MLLFFYLILINMRITATTESVESGVTQKTTEKYVEEREPITQAMISTGAAEVTLTEALFRLADVPTPKINVSSLCVCDLLVSQCDMNCCCDTDCSTSDFGTFTSCSVESVTDDSRLCRQQTAIYSINITVNPPQRVLTLAEQSNPDLFCIQKANYDAGLTFASPKVPSSDNFNDLVKQFGGFSFSAETDIQEQTGSTGYQYGVPVQTTLNNRDYLKLPAPHSASQCTDNNPAGFLMNQAVQCSRSVTLNNCLDDAALNMTTYHNFSIFAEPLVNNTVDVTIQSITLQSLNGSLTRGNNTEKLNFSVSRSFNVCTNVVLEVVYVIFYNEMGHITNASVSFVLGAVDKSMIPVQQSFRISFVEENKTQIPLSGNPGYVVGLPLMAGFKPPGSGIIHSTNRYGQLTLLKSSASQDCFSSSGGRMPVLFGYNMVSGCKLRITNTTDCTVFSKIILDILRGQNFPEYVASFGNAKVQNVGDWVQITSTTVEKQDNNCQLPVSLDIVVKWTKYGSLMNPQAKIQNVTENIITVPFSRPTRSDEIKILEILTSVTFIDVSAPAEPGYRAQPTIDAKLPYDFFYPFV